MAYHQREESLVVQSSCNCLLATGCTYATRQRGDTAGGLLRTATLDEVNIETDKELLRKYRYDIPVVMIDGVEEYRHRVTPRLRETHPGPRV